MTRVAGRRGGRQRSGEHGGKESRPCGGCSERDRLLLVRSEREAQREGLPRHEAPHPKILHRQAVSLSRSELIAGAY